MLSQATKNFSKSKENQDNTKSNSTTKLAAANSEPKWNFGYDFVKERGSDNPLALLDDDACDKFKIDICMIEKVLSSHDLFVNVPNYVNGKSTSVNINLIKTSLAILMKGYLTFQQIHEIMIAFDTKVKELGTDNVLPLTEKTINESLRPIGLSIPQSLFHMWIKKCWNFLKCATIE